jgi:hypothetical protein
MAAKKETAKKEEKKESSLIVVSRLGELVRDNDCMMGGDFVDAINAEVMRVVKKACDRTKAFGKKTVGAESV